MIHVVNYPRTTRSTAGVTLGMAKSGAGFYEFLASSNWSSLFDETIGSEFDKQFLSSLVLASHLPRKLSESHRRLDLKTYTS